MIKTCSILPLLLTLIILLSSCQKDNEKINSSPKASFVISAEAGNTQTIFFCDAIGSSDNEDPVSTLQVRWDWEGDGIWDTDWTNRKDANYIFINEGVFNITLQVKDSNGLYDTTSTIVSISLQGVTGEPCPGIPVIRDSDGNYYNTVLIGEQCWMKDNLRIGKMISAIGKQSDNGILEKYCYQDNADSCIKYGALYQWNEMMQYSTQEGIQGICPEGWHIPTDEEVQVLEGVADSEYEVGSSLWYYHGMRGFDVGKNLKSIQGWQNDGGGPDELGFSMKPSGFWHSLGSYSFNNVTRVACLWTSSVSPTPNYPWARIFNYGWDKLSRDIKHEEEGYSVRCLKD